MDKFSLLAQKIISLQAQGYSEDLYNICDQLLKFDDINGCYRGISTRTVLHIEDPYSAGRAIIYALYHQKIKGADVSVLFAAYYALSQAVLLSEFKGKEAAIYLFILMHSKGPVIFKNIYDKSINANKKTLLIWYDNVLSMLWNSFKNDYQTINLGKLDNDLLELLVNRYVYNHENNIGPSQAPTEDAICNGKNVLTAIYEHLKLAYSTYANLGVMSLNIRTE